MTPHPRTWFGPKSKMCPSCFLVLNQEKCAYPEGCYSQLAENNYPSKDIPKNSTLRHKLLDQEIFNDKILPKQLFDHLLIKKLRRDFDLLLNAPRSSSLDLTNSNTRHEALLRVQISLKENIPFGLYLLHCMPSLEEKFDHLSLAFKDCHSAVNGIIHTLNQWKGQPPAGDSHSLAPQLASEERILKIENSLTILKTMMTEADKLSKSSFKKTEKVITEQGTALIDIRQALSHHSDAIKLIETFQSDFSKSQVSLKTEDAPSLKEVIASPAPPYSSSKPPPAATDEDTETESNRRKTLSGRLRNQNRIDYAPKFPQERDSPVEAPSPDTPTLSEVKKAKTSLSHRKDSGYSYTSQEPPTGLETQSVQDTDLFNNEYASDTASVAPSVADTHVSFSNPTKRDANIQKWVTTLKQSSDRFKKPRKSDGTIDEIVESVYKRHASKRITKPDFALDLKAAMKKDLSSRYPH